MTVGSTPLLIHDRTRDCRKQLRCIPNLQRLTEEELLFWFDLCGCRFTEEQDKNTGISEETSTSVVIGNQQDRNKTVMTMITSRNVAA